MDTRTGLYPISSRGLTTKSPGWGLLLALVCVVGCKPHGTTTTDDVIRPGTLKAPVWHRDTVSLPTNHYLVIKSPSNLVFFKFSTLLDDQQGIAYSALPVSTDGLQTAPTLEGRILWKPVFPQRGQPISLFGDIRVRTFGGASVVLEDRYRYGDLPVAASGNALETNILKSIRWHDR